MGLIFSWFKGSKDQQVLQDVTVEQQKAVVEKTEPPQAVPTPLSTDGALESLSAGLTSSAPSIAVEEPAVCDSVQTTLRSSLPPADKKTKTEDEGSVPSEALNALGDLLPEAEPEPEPVKVDPKDIVTEGVVEDEEGVLVGENEESIPPEYRFSEENGTDLPPAKEEEPSVDSGEALDILSGDFKTVVTVPKQPQVTGLDMDVNLDADVDDAPPVTDLAENFGSDMVPAQS